MEGLISALLIVTVSSLACSIIWFFYRIPLIFRFSFFRTGEEMGIRLYLNWGLADLMIVPGLQGTRGEMMIGRTCIVSRPLEMSSETGSDEEEPVGDVSTNPIPFLPVIYRFLKDCIHCIRPDALKGQITLGTGNPAATGMVYGYYQAIMPLTPEWCTMTIIPDFSTLKLEGTVTGGFRIEKPLYLVLRTARNCLGVFIRKGQRYPWLKR